MAVEGNSLLRIWADQSIHSQLENIKNYSGVFKHSDKTEELNNAGTN